MPRSPEQTRALFDHWSATYDQDVQHSTGIHEGYAETLSAAAQLMALPADARILDVGIGTGAFSELVGAGGAHITGIDVSEQMLDTCRAKHPDYALHPGSFTAVPFEDAMFSAAISSFAFHEVPLPERDRACGELWRVLKPGGLLCLVDIMFASASATDEARQRLGGEWDDDENYALVGELDTALRRAGFRALQWQQTAPCHWFVIGRKPRSNDRPV